MNKTKSERIACPKAGYFQHTSPNFPNTALILNVLIQMKNDNKADSTIKFTRKALTFLGKHTNTTMFQKASRINQPSSKLQRLDFRTV
jgi:hypothetical protein